MPHAHSLLLVVISGLNNRSDKHHQHDGSHDDSSDNMDMRESDRTELHRRQAREMIVTEKSQFYKNNID